MPQPCVAPPPASVIQADVPLQPVLEQQAELLCVELRECLVRVESVLARAEVALGKLQVVPIGSLLPELQVGSADGEEVDLYGGFSPRARPCSMVSTDVGGEVIVEVVAPILHIMPELTVLCEESTPPLSVAIPKEMGLLGALAVPTTPSPPPLESSQTDFVVCAGLDASVTRSPVTVGHVVPPGGDVVGTNTLAPCSDALFAKELCSLLSSLEAASPGSGKVVACILTEKFNKDKIKKVEKSLKSKNKKSDALGKASAAA